MAGVRRRDVLVRGGAVAVSALVVGGLARDGSPGADPVAASVEPYDLVRTDDQLSLKVTFTSVEIYTVGGQKVLSALNLDVPPSIEFEFPVQQSMEWAHPSQNPKKPIFAAQQNILRVRVPQGVVVPLTAAGLLTALREFEVIPDVLAGVTTDATAPGARAAVVPTAELLRATQAPDANKAFHAEIQRRIAALTPDITEAAPDPDVVPPPSPVGWRTSQVGGPGRLLLPIPGGSTRFTHALEPVRNGDLVEIWHTRMTRLNGDSDRVDTGLKIRTTGYVTSGVPATGDWAADVDETKLATLTPGEASAIWGLTRRDDPKSRLTMTHLRLSPMVGLSTQVSGSWKQLPGESHPPAVRSFKNRVVNGRDIVFRKAVSGRLYPFGHAAVLDQTVERRLQSTLSGGQARLEQQSQITVNEPHRTYNANTFPFGSVEILTDTTPVGVPTALHNHIGPTYLVVNGNTFTYSLRGVDKAGNAVDFTMPLVFVPDTHSDFAGLATAFGQTVGPDGTKLWSTGLGHLTVADPVPPPNQNDGAPRMPGATEVIADTAVFTASNSTEFVPAVTQFIGRLPALGHLNDQTNMTITYAGKFAQHGFSALPGHNPGEVVLALGAALPVTLNDAASVGGLIAPVAADLTGMSRRLGAVAGPLETIGNGTFDPSTYLQNGIGSLKLFGVFALGELIRAAGLDDAPRVSAINLGGLRTRTFTWSVPLFTQQQEIGTAIAKLRPIGGAARLTVTSVVSVGTDGNLHQHTTCEITNVEMAIRLGGEDIVVVPFASVTFDSVDGAKPTVDVGLGKITFGGVLGYVNRLAEVIDKLGFGRPQGPSNAAAAALSADDAGGGPSLEVTTTGVRAGFTLAVPSLAIGMFSLENIAFGAALELPFQNGSPALEFHFATQENPFRVTVSFLGGGGFLGLRLSAGGGLEWLEGSLEFGAQLAINLGIVKGKVAAMGGVYFRYENSALALTGYLSIKGEVSVLSLITCGVIQTLSLEYREGKLSGAAELVFYISTFFFSKTIRKKFERTFVGSNGDPTFAELMAPGGSGARPWDTYCTAFA